MKDYPYFRQDVEHPVLVYAVKIPKFRGDYWVQRLIGGRGRGIVTSLYKVLC